MWYFFPFLPSNLIIICSGGRFSRHRKQRLFAISSFESFAADDIILAGLNCNLTVSPPASTSRTRTFFNALKLSHARLQRESWSPTNLISNELISLFNHEVTNTELLSEYMLNRAMLLISVLQLYIFHVQVCSLSYRNTGMAKNPTQRINIHTRKQTSLCKVIP